MNKISVIMLTYNREKLLGVMIECILKQTFTEFEFIIVDNGSTDKSGVIAEEYAKRDQRIRVIHKERGNIGSGRNTGLDAANGEYIVFVDDDDNCQPDFLRFLYDLIVENNADISICGATWANFDEKHIMTSEQAITTLLWRKKYNVAFPTKMFRRSMFDKNRFLETGKYDDIYLLPKMLVCANKVAYYGLAKYHFNRHDSNNSAWTQNHMLLDAVTLQEYVDVYKSRTIWLTEMFPDSADKWRYFYWSFLLSMTEKVDRYKLTDCYDIQRTLIREILANKSELLTSGYLQDYEKEIFNMEFLSKGRVAIFGAGLIGQRLCTNVQQGQKEEVICFVDNNAMLWGTDIHINNINYPIISPEQIMNVDYDKICIAVKGAEKAIYTQCVTTLNIHPDKIDCSFLDNFINNIEQQYLMSRNWFLENFCYLAELKKIPGAVAEVGVFRGAFAKEINRHFPERTLYLYDTFEGFNDADIKQEILFSGDVDSINEWLVMVGNFTNTSCEYVLSQMPYPQQCIVKKGYFPETFDENKETFAFVNLDCDLYNPIKAGLELFYPRLSKGGVILVHEYFDSISFLPGIKAAVNEFAAENDCTIMPIGDRESIAIIK